MYHVRTTRSYRKAFKKLRKSGADVIHEIDIVVDILRKGETLATKYKDHQLTGDMKDYRECHVRPDILLVYYKEENDLILVLVNVGGHSKLFGK